jgi:hypothetical protein
MDLPTLMIPSAAWGLGQPLISPAKATQRFLDAVMAPAYQIFYQMI